MADLKRGAKGLTFQLAVAIELVLVAFTLLATVQAEEHEIAETPAAAMATGLVAHPDHGQRRTQLAA
jgi:hypothetical protein